MGGLLGVESRNYLYDKVKKYKPIGEFENHIKVSLVHKYLYSPIGKVANSSIKNYLYKVEYLPVGKSILSVHNSRASPLLSPYQLPINVLNDVLFGNYYRFTFVRNPYSRLLPCYLDRILTLSSRPSRRFRRLLIKEGKDAEKFSFEDFIKLICRQESYNQDVHWRVQSDDLMLDMLDYDFIGHFEWLWRDMKYISDTLFGNDMFKLADPTNNLSPNKTNSSDKIYEYYTPLLADLVYDRYRKDFDNFNYDKLSF